VLHHEEQPVDVVRELARVVRGGARVAVLDGDGGGSFPLLPWPPEFEQRLRAAALRAEHERYGDELPYYFTGYLGRRLPEILLAAGLADVKLHAFADVDRAPLDPPYEAEMCRWFLESFGQRLRNYLAPADMEQLSAYFTPGSERYLPTRPDFFRTSTNFLAVGTRVN
jgi:SAM-dependent methyltransferase